jgi:hypothetical protein
MMKITIFYEEFRKYMPTTENPVESSLHRAFIGSISI